MICGAVAGIVRKVGGMRCPELSPELLVSTEPLLRCLSEICVLISLTGCLGMLCCMLLGLVDKPNALSEDSDLSKDAVLFRLCERFSADSRSRLAEGLRVELRKGEGSNISMS